jgi:SPX domain protein involved in polyphosphate accumulation
MAKKKEFSFRAPIKHAFEELTALGYFAKERHTCCQSCGFNEIPADKEKIVFYHDQDLDDLKESGSCYLSWAGNGREIVGVLEKHGLIVKWDGSSSTRIHIQLQKKDVATREMISGKTKYNLR